jgi:hypothetical protein|tara:strand:+ start:330 stop:506 length:177 start_codon:yes stop_codon:yes gene_type:complete
MELKRNLELTEIQKFLKEFGDKNPPLKYKVVANANGEIINVISTNKDIIKHSKELGLE